MTLADLDLRIAELSMRHQTRPSRYLWCRLIEAYAARARLTSV